MKELFATYFESLANSVGLTTPALTLFLSLLAGYPLALIHRHYIYGKDAKLQHLYFILTGLMLGYLNYGIKIAHNVFTVIFVYLTFIILPGSLISLAIAFVFTMSYLLIGYFYTSTNQYDITWTMPHCILTLRLIGTAFDLYDGRQPTEKMSGDTKETALVVKPTFLELMGHCFFPSSFLIGPQFPMKRYLNFVSGKFSSNWNGSKPQPLDCIHPAMKRFFLGVVYCIVFHILQIFVSNEYLLSAEFTELSIFRRLWLLGVWGRYTLYKYITCWLFAEGACILFGVAYNGLDGEGKPRWDGCENVKLSVFENATEFGHYIHSFNTNTNNWVAKYVYKRLKFLGNRYISQGAVLFFLAVWHGLHSGYYVCFLMEFIVMYMEKDVSNFFKGKN
ncbi:lysophospholipid acyltransferase 5 [Agrilus planipennis]|uniref:Lysophospholipid acyltransferase 5 n=1 Tax=Agrilus planipennis TaxID=224129 RepID=A0A1W4WF49_AGRPL|nr:lysophospholipid acyltransferase 5 [Agrilus planipennis]